MRSSFAGGVFLCLAALACSPARGGAPAVPTRAPAAPAGARVVLPSGAAIAVEIAKTDDERAQGLMYRASMPQDRGMVFLFEGLEVRPFWMKNCHFPLDIIYTLKDGTVVDVLRDVPPCAADPCPSYPPKAKSDTVVEVNAGVAPKNGVVPSAKLIYRDVPGR
ncbi:MAG TPA: DUF192 domain-containing protein [Thermoanaerobaculia bacterium]|nr:DUF192 domain-containing protein [Thermoanaerobaculia bacterium]